MKEITTVVTAKITMINMFKDDVVDDVLNAVDPYKVNLKKCLKIDFNADDVQIDLQNFILDVKDDADE